MGLGARHLGWVSACAGALLVAVSLIPVVTSPAHSSAASPCAGFARESLARERRVTGHGPSTAVLGDSYSAGHGLKHPDRNWATWLPGTVHVFGFSGSGFSHGAGRCRGVAYDQRAQQVLGVQPDLVVVEGGLNDFNQPAAEIRAGFRRLVGELGCRRLLVVGPPRAPRRAVGAARVDGVLRREAARSGTPYQSMIGYHFSYLPDRLHLTPAGHRQFGTVVAQALADRSDPRC